MAYFSRLTDIVTCNLTTLLARNNNCEKFLSGIVSEMHEGIAGAQRCVNTAVGNVSRLETEIGEQRQAAQQWVSRAQASLKQKDDNQARLALERKYEVEDLVAGLEQQLQAAIATRDHLNTMLSALQARLADANRRLLELHSGETADVTAVQVTASILPLQNSRQSRVDSELESLRKQMELS